MRKFLSVFLVCFLVICNVTAVNAQSVGDYSDAQLRPDYNIVIDGKECGFKNAQGESVYPILYNNSTYLPIRAIGEIMGKNVNWDETDKTVTLSGNKAAVLQSLASGSQPKKSNIDIQVRTDFKIVIDNKICKFKDEKGNNTYPILYNGSTYLPIRAIGELMNKNVSWDNSSKTVTLSGNTSSTVTDADSFNSTTNDSTIDNNNDGSQKGDIGAKRAKEIAAEHAGFNVGKVNFIKSHVDFDDGRKIYELEFTAGNKKYEYDIDAKTGDVLDYDADHDLYD